MKNIKYYLGLVIFIFSSMFSSDEIKGAKKNPEFTQLTSLRKAEYRLFHSSSLNHDYHIYVNLPDGYDPKSKKKYPTIYLLDGGVTFPLFAGLYRYLRFAEDVPDLIIVGISYGSDDFRKGNNRGSDFTAPAESRAHYGGAEKFQQMFINELFPLIEKNYSSDAKKRILFGQSLGGQFALYNVLTKPETFWGYIASNPALHRNLDFFMKTQYENMASSAKGSKKAKLFVSSGENNDLVFKVPEQKWLKKWQADEDKDFELKAVQLENHNHFSIAPESLRNGLIWLFSTEKNSISHQ